MYVSFAKAFRLDLSGRTEQISAYQVLPDNFLTRAQNCCIFGNVFKFLSCVYFHGIFHAAQIKFGMYLPIFVI